LIKSRSAGIPDRRATRPAMYYYRCHQYTRADRRCDEGERVPFEMVTPARHDA